MQAFKAEDLALWSGGQWKNGPPGSPATGFCYDTRKLQPGDLFVAIKTTTRDGHDFLEDARGKGAIGALVQEFGASSALPQLVVKDSLEGFRSIAAGYRAGWSAKVIGVTGSCGKTTVKNLLLHLLGGHPVAQGTRGNLNNLIGVPATIMEVDSDQCAFAVIEAGISEPGEMEKLAGTINPDTVVFTSIGPAHLESLGDVKTVASEKGLLAALPTTLRAYLGETCIPYRESLFTNSPVMVAEQEEDGELWGYRRSPDGFGTHLELNGPEGAEEYRVEGVGKALASNAALAIAVVRDLGISSKQVAARLSSWKSSELRGEWRSFGSAKVYLDCYNANPLSMMDALDAFEVLSDSGRARLYVIGSMEELGAQSEEWHRRLGESLSLREQDRLYLIGDESDSVINGMSKAGNRIENTAIISDVEAVRTALSGFKGDVFLKGSRRYRLEGILDFIPDETRSEEVSC